MQAVEPNARANTVHVVKVQQKNQYTELNIANYKAQKQINVCYKII